jgi:hypothetical protein
MSRSDLVHGRPDSARRAGNPWSPDVRELLESTEAVAEPRRRVQRRWAVRVTIVAVCCALLGTALSARDDGSGQPGNQEGRMFSSFRDHDLDLVGYAQIQSTATCLAHAGYPRLAGSGLPPPGRDIGHLRVDLALFGPATEAYARSYGFGPGPNVDWQPPQLLGSGGAFGTRLVGCEQRAWRAIGPHARQVYLDYVALSGVVSSEYDSLMTGTIQAENLNADLLDCLTADGYTALDRAAFLANPFPGHFGIKTGSLQVSPDTWRPPLDSGTVQVTLASLQTRYVPTPEEAEFAAAFAHCSRKTGRLERLLATSRQAQDRIIREHEAEMTVLNTKLAPLARRAAALTEMS